MIPAQFRQLLTPEKVRPMSARISAFANALLAELRADPGTPLTAQQAGELVGLSGLEAGQNLRQLHAVGLAEREVLPSGQARWSATDAGRTHHIDLTGIDAEIARLEQNRDTDRWQGRR
jgi:predicted ArsR family transcriptional regulator